MDQIEQMIRTDNRYFDIFQNHLRLAEGNQLGDVRNCVFYLVRNVENINRFNNHYVNDRYVPATVGGEIAAIYDPTARGGINVSVIFKLF